LEIARPVTFADTGDQVVVELVDEDTGDDKTVLSPSGTTPTEKTEVDNVEAVAAAVQTSQVTATVSIPAKEP